MPFKSFKDLFKTTSNNTKDIGVDRRTAKPRPTKKDFKEIVDTTFKKHEKSFEKLAE